MSDYLIEITESAQSDLRQIIYYIQTDLSSPSTADNFMNGIEEAMEQLSFMLEKFQLVRDDYLASKGYRSTRYKNYLIFYIINYHMQTVFIHRILPASRHWEYLI